MIDAHKIGNWILGTCKSSSDAIEHFDLDIDENELEEMLLDINIECCQGCQWWCESWELVDDEYDNVGFCEECRNG